MALWCVQKLVSLHLYYITLSFTFSFRTYTNALVSGILGNTFVGYYTYEDAIEEYEHAKAHGLIEVMRDPGDDDIFGPIKYAIM